MDWEDGVEQAAQQMRGFLTMFQEGLFPVRPRLGLLYSHALRSTEAYADIAVRGQQLEGRRQHLGNELD